MQMTSTHSVVPFCVCLLVAFFSLSAQLFFPFSLPVVEMKQPALENPQDFYSLHYEDGISKLVRFSSVGFNNC